MNKNDFFSELTAKLSKFPKCDIAKSISYYEEMLYDRIEDGMTEEDAIKSFGSIDDIVSNILSDLSVSDLIKSNIKNSKNNASNESVWHILVILGIPFWLPILLCCFILILAMYLILGSLLFVSYTIPFALGLAGIIGSFAGIAILTTTSLSIGITFVGASLILISIPLFLLKSLNTVNKIFLNSIKNVTLKIKSLLANPKGA